ncbi:hypothetical protein [Nocardia spumae]|uniref:hypothetical protein n=1 Tax=Nocardia spumae TaxID=2887190 RepID=UPI001D15187A|nr:hypothetical protein [Nocardia spumae]
MKLQRLTAVSALVVGALTAGTAAVHADPGPAPAPSAIKYSVKLVDKTVVATLQGGTFRLAEDGRSYAVTDAHGATVVSLPTEIRLADTAIPVKSVIGHDDTVLELTPERTVTVEHPGSAVRPIASAMENHKALNDFDTNFGIATAVGTFLGTAVGAIVGGITGCILGLPLLGLGCIPAAVAGAGIGGVLGTIVIGGPALAITGFDVINTLSAAPGTTKWADDK